MNQLKNNRNYNGNPVGLAGNAKIPCTLENVATALSFVSPNLPRDEWVKILFAVYDALGDDGRDIAEEWSRNSDKYKAADFRDTWKSCRSGKVQIGTLWRSALEAGWKPNGEAHQESEAERLERERRWKAREAEERIEREQREQEAARRTATLWSAAIPAQPDHPYLARKGINPVPTLREIPAKQAAEILGYTPKSNDEPLKGRLIIVPVKRGGELATAELIDEDGRKTALAGGPKSGGVWAAQPLEDDGTGITIAIGEGVATVLSVHQATGHPVIAALSCHNLSKAAAIMRERFPAARLVILADIGNGQTKAEEAARVVGAALAVPQFQEGSTGTDFNDLAVLAGGLELVREQVEAALAEPIRPTNEPDPKAEKRRNLPLICYLNGDPKKPRLVKQSQAAANLRPLLDDLAFDSVQQCWLRFQGGVWRRISDMGALAAIMDAIDKNGGEMIGYDSTYPNGIAVFLKARLCADDFDQKPHLIPLKNGVFDTTTRTFSEHDKAHRLTWQLPYPYAPGATCKPVTDWLLESVGGDPDQVELLQAYIRAVLMGRADLQRYLELIGKPGTGKGTFLRLVTAIVGERNSHTTTMKQLETNRFETANLYGKRLCQITDADKYQGDTSILKAMTGGDYLPFEAKHKQGGENFRFGGMVLIAANDVTVTGDYSGALQRRRITVRFENAVDPTKRRDLESEFEPYLPGVINWVLSMSDERMVELLRDTDRQVKKAAESNLRMLLETNPVAAWAAERLVHDSNAETKVGQRKPVTITENDLSGTRKSHDEFEHADTWLYASYATWCAENNKRDLGLNNFSNALENVLRDQFKIDNVKRLPNSNSKGVRFKGVRIRGEADKDLPELLSFSLQYGLVRPQYDYSTATTLESTDSMTFEEKYMAMMKGQHEKEADSLPSVGKKTHIGKNGAGGRTGHTASTFAASSHTGVIPRSYLGAEPDDEGVLV